MATDSGIDPRYSAQFQRGFDPARHAPDPVMTVRGPQPNGRTEPPTVQRVAPPPPLAQPPVATPEPRVTAEARELLEEDDPGLPTLRPRLEWALLGVGLALLIAAGLMFVEYVEQQSRQYSGNGMSLDDQVAYFVLGALPGPFIVGGAVAICLWVVLRAVPPTGGERR